MSKDNLPEPTSAGNDLEVLDDFGIIEAAIRDPNVRVEVPGPENPEELAALIAGEILDAEDPLAMVEAFGSKEFVGTPLRLERVKFARSKLGEGQGFYAVMLGTLEDGSPAAVTTSARNILATLVNLLRRDGLPADVQISEATSAQGYKPLRLVHAKFEEGRDPFRRS